MRFTSASAALILATTAFAAPSNRRATTNLSTVTDTLTNVVSEVPVIGSSLPALPTTKVARTDLTSLSSTDVAGVAKAAGITLPANVISEAESISSSVPEIASIIVGVIKTIRSKASVLEDTPLEGVVDLVLPIIEALLSSLKNTYSFDKRDFTGITTLIDTLVSSIISTLDNADDILSGIAGGAQNATATAGSGASDIVSTVVGGVVDEIADLVTGLIASASSTGATSALNSLPGISSVTDLTQTDSVTSGVTDSGALGEAGTISTDVLSKVVDALDFVADNLEVVTAIPAVLLPSPLDVPFEGLVVKLEIIRSAIHTAEGALTNATSTIAAGDVEGVSAALSNVTDAIATITTDDLPALVESCVDYTLGGLVKIVEAALIIVAGYASAVVETANKATGTA